MFSFLKQLVQVQGDQSVAWAVKSNFYNVQKWLFILTCYVSPECFLEFVPLPHFQSVSTRKYNKSHKCLLASHKKQINLETTAEKWPKKERKVWNILIQTAEEIIVSDLEGMHAL